MAILCMARPWKHPKTGVYYFRRAIPEALRPFIPKGDPRHEYKRSLHTKEAAKAKRLYADAAAICDDYFAGLKAAKDRAASSVAPNLDHRRAVTEEDATPSPPVSLRVLAGELGQEIIARNPGAPPDAAFRANKSLPPGPWGDKADPWTRHRYLLALSARSHAPASAEGNVTAPSRDFLAARGIVLGPDEWEEFCGFAREAIDAALEALQRRHREGDKSDAPLRQRFDVGAAASHPRVSIKGLIQTWAKVRAAAKKASLEKYDRRLREFASFLKHDDALAVTSKDLRRWRDHLKGAGLSVKTINDDCVGPVMTVFRLAAAEEVVPAFPFPGSYALKEDATKPKSRRPYEDDEAAQVLSAARKEPDGPMRWIPWLLAYTGARVGEIAQLRVSDIRERDGIRYLQITNEGEGQSVKTSASRRDVPLHRAVVREGFLKFTASIARGGYLFAAPSGRTAERKAAGASQNYMRWLRKIVGITDTRLVSHSWRHRMEDQLREVDAPEEVAAAITGRTRTGSRAGYGKGPSLATKARWLAKVPVVKIDRRGSRTTARQQRGSAAA